MGEADDVGGGLRAFLARRPHAEDLTISGLRRLSYQWFLYPREVDLVRLHEALAGQLADRLRPRGSLRKSARARGSGR
jgi:hypothetical protein